jgi:hypothetical protein
MRIDFYEIDIASGYHPGSQLQPIFNRKVQYL